MTVIKAALCDCQYAFKQRVGNAHEAAKGEKVRCRWEAVSIEAVTVANPEEGRS